MDPMQPGQEIPQQANNGTPNPTSLEDFIRQNAGVPVQQQPVQQQPAAAPVQPDPQLFPQNNVAATGIPPVQTQVVEKIVYKKQKVHGFFRTLTIIALVVV
ncbi:TPA: hypothetical protein DEP21_02055 [Patescibacteria group bacterium]|nr:hypothetical protein [Candidatus Gracilibacteria bacterium]